MLLIWQEIFQGLCVKGTEPLSTRISSLQRASEQRLSRGEISRSLKLCLSRVFTSSLWHPGQDLLHPMPWLCPHVAERTSHQLLCRSCVPKPKQSAVPSTTPNLSQHAGRSTIREGRSLVYPFHAQLSPWLYHGIG